MLICCHSPKLMPSKRDGLGVNMMTLIIGVSSLIHKTKAEKSY